MPLFRSKSADYQGGQIANNGIGLVGSCDYNGNLWVRSVKQPTRLAWNRPATGVLATVTTPLLTFPMCTAIHASLCAAAAATAQQVVQLIANFSGGGTQVVWEDVLCAPASTRASITMTDLQADIEAITGAVATDSFTLAFLAAPAAGEQQTVSVEYFDRA
ncbi:MAG: hypothetical protein KGJ13_10445 [Patescibacteria group bacterium]|nr:hypothetical protein [Patescibacteria group bacterium]